MQTTDPRTLGPTAFGLGFGVAQALVGEYQRLAARGRMERACAIHAHNATIRASNARIRSRRAAEAADAELALLDVELGLV
jgi:hypothetical protein